MDQTLPAVKITGVEDKSANKGDVIPVITYSDVNIDWDSVKITLVGANNGEVNYPGSEEEIENGKIFTYKNFAKEEAVDDVYTLTATVTDLAGNEYTDSIRFSVNRFGSTYELSESTTNLNGTYVQTPVDVVVNEYNADELGNVQITLFKNNQTIVLEEGKDYDMTVAGGNGEWYVYTYVVHAANFANDGVYRLTFHSEDAAGNVAENTLDTKNMAVSFGVDSTAPMLSVANLESRRTYNLENMTVLMSVSDNLVLTSVMVYLDDMTKPLAVWDAEQVAAIISAGGEFNFDVPGNSTKAHNVRIFCRDAAGNETVEDITGFYVTTNLFVRYFNNKPLFFGSIVGTAAVAASVYFMIAKKKKEKKEAAAK